MSSLPDCVNFIKKRGCAKSDVRLINEKDDAWVLQCQTCKCVQVVSKDGVRDKSKFETEMRRRKEQEQLERARSRRRVFV